jgi:hypothetical protein
LTTNEKMFPKWESKPTTLTPALLEYKYIMVDSKGNAKWESGDNRKVDLTTFAGHSVMVEDDGWNNKNRPAKVYPLGNMPAPSDPPAIASSSVTYSAPVVTHHDTQYTSSV